MMRLPALRKGGANGGPMRFPHAFVFSDECREADRLRSVERQIPTGAMPDLFTRLGLNRVAMLDELLARCGMLPFGQTVKRLGRNRSGESQPGGELAMPFAAKSAALAEVGV